MAEASKDGSESNRREAGLVQAVSFEGKVLSGHKQNAVEVPFSPSEKWGVKARTIEKGRNGYAVRGSIQGTAFSSHVVARSGRYWLLLDPQTEQAAGIGAGSAVSVVLQAPPVEA